VIVRQMSAKKFEAFLVDNDACDEAMIWYRKQPKRDLRSIVKAVDVADWLTWLLKTLLHSGHVSKAPFDRSFVIPKGAPSLCNRPSCILCYFALFGIEGLRKKITVR
jgi:hypothetical protein